MSFVVKFSSQAKKDIKTIGKYLKYEVSDEKALSFLSDVESYVDRLSFMPERFQAFEKRLMHFKNIRIMPLKKYLVIYNVDNKKRRVTIIRVISSSQKDKLF